MSRKKNNEVNNSLKLKNVIEDRDVNDLKSFIKEKTEYIQNIIRNTIISIKKNRYYEIFSNNDISLSINVLNELYEKTREITNKINAQVIETDKLIEILQKVIDKLSMIICGFGTTSVDDLLFISFGSEYVNIKTNNLYIKDKYELIQKYVHPIGYKIIHWKQNKNKNTPFTLCANKLSDDIIIVDEANMFECFDVEPYIKLFYQKIYGIRVVIQNEKLKKTLIINGIIDDIQLECFSNHYIDKRKNDLLQLSNSLAENEKVIFQRIVDTLTLKEILICGDGDIHKKMIMVLTEANIIKNNKLDITIKRFLEMDLYHQRNLLVNLLIYNKEDEILYICYLLYDLICVNSASDNIDTTEQTLLYDSLPWKIKTYFKDAVKYSMKYTHDMMQKYDVNRITLEQQIYLMKASDIVKEKAMVKLKEIKNKSDESGTKAKQYLEGLTKIPFGVYKEEPILTLVKDMNQIFSKLTLQYGSQINDTNNVLIKKEKYTNIEMIKFIKNANNKLITNIFTHIQENIPAQSLKQLTSIMQYINKKNNKENKINISKQTKSQKINEIVVYLKENPNDETTITDVYDLVKTTNSVSLSKTYHEMNTLQNNISNIENVMNNITNTLDESIYSHNNAKNQILKIIGQWMNGEQTGYSFGFEGSPGVGKTSLAKKGLANCLKDNNGVSRPFSFIALGGSCNGSTLEGHGYTYVNSTWGRIVDILIESKCLNPIIYIDELDKVSKTENGKEIIGILTHLIDQTQNDSFQDKYFAGINIDLSKALFIFSYNDPEQIDKILLDRIHRIRFENLSLDDKIVIVKKYILPEINKKMGFQNIIEIDDSMIEHIIESYTIEPGVRKLKELLFDLYGEINIELLKCKEFDSFELPIKITEELLENKYLSKYHKIREKKIHENPTIGIINGLWANSLGKGGVIPIQTMFFPSTTFLDLRLTGLQGDVMKESMNVAKTLAWDLTPLEVKKDLIKYFEETKCQGLHIHCPEGAVSKDGPSAGTAITTAIYSLLNKKLIRNDVAITGEINLQGEVTAIGGLSLKILGGIKAGVKTFIYPESNHRDFVEFEEIYGSKPIIKDIIFKEVKRIDEVFEIVFSNE
jgi:ATP-dependent Lon protease